MKTQKKHITKPETAATETFVQTKTALAAACLIGRSALNRYLNMDGAPSKVEGKGWPVALVKRWIIRHAKGTAIATKHDPELQEFQRWETFEKARRLRNKNERDERITIPISEHESELMRRVNNAQSLMAAMASRLAPQIAGLTVAEAETLLRNYCDKIIAAARGED